MIMCGTIGTPPLHSSTANKHFLRSMARVGGGYEEFFDTKTKSKWERKVKGQLSKSFQPALTSVSVQWQQFDENAPTPIQVSTINVWVWSVTHPPPTGPPGAGVTVQWVSTGGVRVCPSLHPGHTEGQDRQQARGDHGVHL